MSGIHLPPGWREVAAAELMPGSGVSINPARFPDEEFDLYSIPAYDGRVPDLVSGSEIGSNKQTVTEGDVLLSKIVPHIRRAWVVGSAQGRRQIASSEWIVFRSEATDPGFLRHFLVSDRFHAQFMNTVSGVGGSLLRARPAFVAQIPIPLPPLGEQRRIAGILDAADALRAKRRESIALLDGLTQSIFMDMFGDPVNNPRGWPVTSLDHASAMVVDCPHSTPKWTSEGFTCLRTANLGTGDWVWSDHRFVSETTYHERSKRAYLEPGDIVLSREGTVGVAAVVPKGMKACMGQRLVQVRVDPDLLVPEYFLQALLYLLAPTRIGSLMVGSTARHLNVGDLRDLHIQIPPISLQDEFLRRIRASRRALLAARRANEELDRLFSSVQARAFRGELL